MDSIAKRPTAALTATLFALWSVLFPVSVHAATYNASGNFTGRVKVRRGGASPIKPFETTFAVGSTGGGTNLIRTLD